MVVLAVAALGVLTQTGAASATTARWGVTNGGSSSPPRLFGTYAKGFHWTSSLIAAARARYGAMDAAIPAWHADTKHAPPSAAAITALASEGVFAALSVCAYASDWQPTTGSPWNEARGLACIKQVAGELGKAGADSVQAVIDGSQVDDFATPAEQVTMYDLAKQYFPKAEVIAYHACQLRPSRLPGGQDGGYGSAGRSADVIYLRVCGALPGELKLVNTATAATGAVGVMIQRNANQLTTTHAVDAYFQTVEKAAAIHPISVLTVRPLSTFNAAQWNAVAAEIKADMAGWLNG